MISVISAWAIQDKISRSVALEIPPTLSSKIQVWIKVALLRDLILWHHIDVYRWSATVPIANEAP